jgi:hypothetical protein
LHFLTLSLFSQVSIDPCSKQHVAGSINMTDGHGFGP